MISLLKRLLTKLATYHNFSREYDYNLNLYSNNDMNSYIVQRYKFDYVKLN